MQICEIHMYFNRCCHSSTHLCAICCHIFQLSYVVFQGHVLVGVLP